MNQNLKRALFVVPTLKNQGGAAFLLIFEERVSQPARAGSGRGAFQLPTS
jgi:hypothetical protein